MIELVLVRHGQPHWEPDGRAVDNPSLTELGHAQARRTAECLGAETFDGVYVSPLLRARETAAPIGEALGLEPQVESFLEELRLPTMHGLTSEEVKQFFAQANSRELDSWWEAMGPGGESFRHFYARVSAGAEDWLDAQHGALIHEDHAHRLWNPPEGDRKLLLVAHEGTNAVLISHLLGIDPVPWAWLRFSSAWCGVTRLVTARVAGGAVWALSGFSQTEHLDGLAESGAGATRAAI